MLFRSLSGLDSASLEILEGAVSSMAEYIGHPSFRRGDIERKLYGQEAAPAPSAVGDLAETPSAIADHESASGDGLTFTSEQEQLAFVRYNYARSRVFNILWHRRGKTLTVEDCRELVLWQGRALQGRAVIIQANMPLVLAMAKRTRLSGVDFAELISEGNLAMLRSADKFDCSRGFKFSTYACRAILKSFSRVAMRVSRYRAHFPMEFAPELERSDYQEQRRLDTEADFLDELRRVIRTNSANLSDIELEVIRARFNLGAPEGVKPAPLTLEQVGRIIGVTKERVRQIQNKALVKLKNVLLDEGEAA